MKGRKFRQQYLKIFPYLNEILQFTQEKLQDLPQPDFIVEINLKDYASAKRKFFKNKLKHPLEMSDLVRGRIFFSEQYEFKDVFHLIQDLLGDFIDKIDKKDLSEYGLDVHDAPHIDLIINGIKFELQILPAEMQPYQDLFHKVYEVLRSENKLSEEQKEKLKKFHNNLYHQVDERIKKNRKLKNKS